MERPLHAIHSGPRQEKTCHVDGGPQCRPDGNRLVIYSFSSSLSLTIQQTFAMRKGTGTKLQGILRLKQKRTRRSFRLRKIRQMQNINLLMSGGSCIPKINTIPISPIGSIVELKESVGDWICVRFHWPSLHNLLTEIFLVVLSERMVDRVQMVDIPPSYL